MQAHTVLRSVVNKYADEPVLVLGGRPGDVPRVAEEWVNLKITFIAKHMDHLYPSIRYGFRNVYTTLDILSWDQRWIKIFRDCRANKKY